MKKNRLLALGLAMVMAFSFNVPVVDAADYSGTNVITEVPGANRTWFAEDSTKEDWFNITGFVADGIGDRSMYYDEYVQNGYKDTANYKVVEEDYYKDATDNKITVEAWEALETLEKEAYTLVTAEEQFINAIADGAKVVQVNALELELGYLYLDEMGINRRGVVEPVTDYEKGNAPITSPVLMETGVSDLMLDSHMTIFSTTACTIRHAGINVGAKDDVVIRNFKFVGLYEWDDVPEGTQSASPGSRKRYGWCYVTGNESHNIWVDHCTFGYAFDGNIDITNGSQVAITWCQFGIQDISEGSELWKNIEYMESEYQKYKADPVANAGSKFGIYYDYREKLAGKGYDADEAVEAIVNYAALHSKVHLVGSGDKDFYTNIQEKVTLAYNYYQDIMQRIPMVRQGNAHMFNCVIDNTRFNNATNTLGNMMGSSPNYRAGARCIDARDAASVAADTCVFRGVNPITGNEKQGDDLANVMVEYQDMVAPMINHPLIVNSMVDDGKGKSDSVYTGSSWDKNGDNPFTKDFEWNNKASIGNFTWSTWRDQSQFLNASGQGDTNLYLKYGSAYYKDFYVGSNELGYDYKAFKLEDTETIVKANSGALADLFDEDETAANMVNYVSPRTRQTEEENYKTKVVVDVVGGEIADKKDNVYYIAEGSNLDLPVAPEVTKTGYDLKGWQEYAFEGGVLTPVGDVQTSVSIEATDTFTTKYYTAVWEIAKYTITFDSTGGNAVAALENVEHGSSFRSLDQDIPEATRDGFTFQGWYDSFDRNNAEKPFGNKLLKGTAFNADTTYYAKWKATKVDLIFHSNGGSEVQPWTGLNINTNSGLPTAPTRDGYTFAGWFYDEALTKEFIANDTVIKSSLSYLIDIDGELNLYAKWEEVNEVTLTFDPMGGTTPDAIKVTPAAAVSELPESTKAEYVFAGWYTDNTDYETEFTTSSAIEADTTVYAKWVKKGDVNGDDVADALDALEILKGVAGMLPQSFTPLQMKQADVEADGSADALDALKILKVVAGMIPGFDS